MRRPGVLRRRWEQASECRHDHDARHGVFGATGRGHLRAMFFFFSNRLGCGGSILLSLAVTVVLLLIFAR
jgi:hypothetical protein